MVSGRIFKGWAQGLQSSSHHSGTARMGHTRKSSVCDAKGQVWGVKGLYVADGSIIPASGFANTGLTIGALALRLGDEIAHQAHAPDNV
jgi:choline dehydrogenase-like flavoprotein